MKRRGAHLWPEIKTSNKSGYNTKILWNLTVRCEKEWNNKNVLLSFVGFQINFTTSCAAVIFLSLFVLVTWGSVWPKIQGILKKAHRGRHPPAIKTHTHARTHKEPKTQSHRITLEKWKTNQKEGQLVSPQMLQFTALPLCCWRSCCTVLLWFLPKYH